MGRIDVSLEKPYINITIPASGSGAISAWDISLELETAKQLREKLDIAIQRAERIQDAIRSTDQSNSPDSNEAPRAKDKSAV